MPSDRLTARRHELQRQSSGFWALFIAYSLRRRPGAAV